MPDNKTVTFDAQDVEKLRKFLDTAAGEGYVLSGIDAGDLYCSLFDENGAPLAPTPAAQSAGQEPIYQARTGVSEWADLSRLQFERIKLDKRIVYAASVSPPELVAHVRKLVNGEILDSTGCLTRWEDLPDGTPIYANAAPVNGGEREAALEEAARLIESTNETVTIEGAGDTIRHLTPRKANDAHNLTGRTWAAAIRALKGGERTPAYSHPGCEVCTCPKGVCQSERAADAQQVGGDRDAIAELIGRLEARYGNEFTFTRRSGEATHHVGFDKHPLVGKAITYLRAALTSPAKEQK